MKTVWILSIVTFAIAGCGQSEDISALKARVASLELQVPLIQGSISEINTRVSELHASDGPDQITYLSPTSRSFSALNTNVGVFAVSIRNVEPYANGTKVVINFGNPTSANISRASTTFEWGRVDSSGLPESETKRTKQHNFTETMFAGSWNPIEIILDGVPPSELGFVGIGALKDETISLKQ